MLLVGFRIFGILLAFLFGNKNHPSAVGPWVMSTILFYNLLVEMPETKFKITQQLTSRDPESMLRMEDTTFPLSQFVVLIVFSLMAIWHNRTTTQNSMKSLNEAIPAYLTIAFSINFLANTYIVEINKGLRDRVLETLCQFYHAMCLGYLSAIVKTMNFVKIISALFLCFSVLLGSIIVEYTSNLQYFLCLLQSMACGIILYTVVMLGLPPYFHRDNLVQTYLGILGGFLITLLYFTV